MDTLSILTGLWAAITTVFIILVIYRANLANHETDQLFLNETAPSSSHIENDAVVRRLNGTAAMAKGFGIATIVLTLAVGTLWIVHTLPTN